MVVGNHDDDSRVVDDFAIRGIIGNSGERLSGTLMIMLRLWMISLFEL